MLYYIVSFFILITTYFVLLITHPIIIHPEFAYYPWIVGKGFLPYRDFFDHHGFFTYFFLAPFITKDLVFVKSIYVGIQIMTSSCLLYLLKKYTSKFLFLPLGILLVVTQYYFSDNLFWYETCINTLLTFIVIFLVEKKFRARTFVLIILMSLVSFIKPQTVIFLIPIYFVERDIRIILSVIISWFLVLILFATQNALPQIIDNLFFFNRFYTAYLMRRGGFFIDRELFGLLMGIYIIVLVLLFLSHGRVREKIIFCGMSIGALALLFPGNANINLLPFVSILIVLIAYVSGIYSQYRHVFFVLICMVIFVMARKVKHQMVYMKPIQSSKLDYDLRTEKLPTSYILQEFSWVDEYFHKKQLEDKKFEL